MTTGVPPAELFLRRALRTRLDLLRPLLSSRVQTKQAQQKGQHDMHSKDRTFEVGQCVLVRNLRAGPKWISGTIIEQTGPVSYRVQVDDQIWRWHADQLLDSRVRIEPLPKDSSLEFDLPDESSAAAASTIPVSSAGPSTDETMGETESVGSQPRPAVPVETSPPRYPHRERKPPDRLSHKY